MGSSMEKPIERGSEWMMTDEMTKVWCFNKILAHLQHPLNIFVQYLLKIH